MNKPRMFLGSSGKQARLLDTLTAGLTDVADVEPWTVVFNPGVSTLERLVELTREVDFAAFIFAHDDWTAVNAATLSTDSTGQASPRDNVVFEAGLFGGALGMRRTFILHANGAKLPTDLLGLTCVRYDQTGDEEVETICQKLKTAIAAEGRLKKIEGLWWQFSQTARSEYEPSAISLLKVSRTRNGTLEVTGRAWEKNGKLSSRYWSEATKEQPNGSGVFYYWNGERPLRPDAPQLWGTAEIRLESVDRASGYWITHAEADSSRIARTSGVYLRADNDDLSTLEGSDDQKRAGLIAEQLSRWASIRNV